MFQGNRVHEKEFSVFHGVDLGYPEIINVEGRYQKSNGKSFNNETIGISIHLSGTVYYGIKPELIDKETKQEISLKSIVELLPMVTKQIKID